MCMSVADPGFPVGGAWTSYGGAVDPRGGYVSKILRVITKESGPVGGGARRARPPRSANACVHPKGSHSKMWAMVFVSCHIEYYRQI